MYGYRQGFYHSTFFICKRIGQKGNFRSIRSKIFACRSRCLKADNFKIFAKVIFTVCARMTAAAIYLRFNRYFLSDSKIAYVLTELYNLPGNFMPLCQRIRYIRMFAMKYVNVASAHPYPLNFNKHLIVLHCGNRDFTECYTVRFFHHLLYHCIFHTFSQSVKKLLIDFSLLL